MSGPGVESQATAVLRAMNASGGYPMALVCTEKGLLIASAGEHVRSEVIAGITSLFDDIAVRAARDLGLADIDELSLSDTAVGRLIVRPLTRTHDPRLFLVVQVPRQRSWRKHTNLAVRSLMTILGPLLATHNLDKESRDP